jgi:hypothetical protein
MATLCACVTSCFKALLNLSAGVFAPGLYFQQVINYWQTDNRPSLADARAKFPNSKFQGW